MTSQEYRSLQSLRKLIFVMTVIVAVLLIIIRLDENVPLWVMIVAVVCACMDGLLVIGYSHSRDIFTHHSKEADGNE